jgi:AmiR/NasT family two-component response regulator
MTMTPPAVGTLTETNLRVLIADENEAALRGLHQVLAQLGHEVTPYAVSVHEAVELIAKEDPEVAIVVVHNDDEHALALIGEAVEYASGPVIAQLPDADVEFLARAAEAGISAYAESMDPESIQGAIEVAVRRYREASGLGEKVEQLESALERRGVIERAKGILMERHSVAEREAFELMRDHARASGRRVIEVAQSVLDGHALLPKRP